MSRNSIDMDPSVWAARAIIDDAWKELKLAPYVLARIGSVIPRLPDLSYEEVNRRSLVGKSLLDRLSRIDVESVPHALALGLRLVKFRAKIWAQEAEWYWVAHDPRGIGGFGLFSPTAYCGAYVLDFAHQQFAACAFGVEEDKQCYLDLVADYAHLIGQFTARTLGQAERGVLMPKVQIPQARALIAGYKQSARAVLSVAPARLAKVTNAEFMRDVEGLVRTLIEPAFDQLLAVFSDTYLSRAPDAVGIAQYPGGAEIYRELVKIHTTLDLTPEEVHSRGLERMNQIEASIAAIQTELGFAGDSAAFLAHLDADPRWRAETEQGVADVFERYIHRLEPHLGDWFSVLPQASYGVRPLPEALQKSMTYGYYDPARSDHNRGYYVFNGANLTKQPLFHLAALTYHELMPGHHLQFSLQQENQSLHSFCAYSFVNAYIEGWAEYAATFAGETGLYLCPEERYGRLVMDAFLTTRLVVDTGMNIMGWSLERAREYMRSHSRLVEAEIKTESIRYSCDIPGQALAYKLGDTEIIAMREKMRGALGDEFQIKDFHQAVLAPGALPFADLAWHVEHATAQAKSRVTACG
jgi:uncharacterized protein (DUF885 family)